MRIVVFHPDPAVTADWLRALRTRLPKANIFRHGESLDADADYGVGWRLPADFFPSHPGLKALLCTGAGVERILCDANLPPRLPIVRLEDAGMGPQMADYCIFETLRMCTTRVLVIVAPLTAATRDRFDRTSLSMLRSSSYVINVARGALIVDEALIELLDTGHIAGAALDVFRQEPLPSSHPFWTHPHVRITPHISAVTLVEPSAQQIADKILRPERGQRISGLVERNRGY